MVHSLVITVYSCQQYVARNLQNGDVYNNTGIVFEWQFKSVKKYLSTASIVTSNDYSETALVLEISRLLRAVLGNRFDYCTCTHKY